VLRLVLEYGEDAVSDAIRTSVRAGAPSYEAVRFELMQELQEDHESHPVPRLDELGPGVKTVDLSVYDRLLKAGDAG
jgi:hypothetical protein